VEGAECDQHLAADLLHAVDLLQLLFLGENLGAGIEVDLEVVEKDELIDVK
jgi:hypothetical protein